MHIAEGDYIFWIVKAKAAGDRLEVTFDTHGRLLTESFPLTGPDMWRLRELLDACGKEVNESAFEKAEAGIQPKINVDKLVGLECGGTVCDDEERGSVIAVFLKASVLKECFMHLRQTEINTERYLM
ncbi:MAG TPA: hypothetical protein VFR24_20160 [Candidatus Angelobacter sp.]|nr:hypothetical protein [Candidatus Angelobacter sp.]